MAVNIKIIGNPYLNAFYFNHGFYRKIDILPQNVHILIINRDLSQIIDINPHSDPTYNIKIIKQSVK